MQRSPRGLESSISMMKLEEMEMVGAHVQIVEKETCLFCLIVKPFRADGELIHI